MKKNDIKKKQRQIWWRPMKIYQIEIMDADHYNKRKSKMLATSESQTMNKKWAIKKHLNLKLTSFSDCEPFHSSQQEFLKTETDQSLYINTNNRVMITIHERHKVCVRKNSKFKRNEKA